LVRDRLIGAITMSKLFAAAERGLAAEAAEEEEKIFW